MTRFNGPFEPKTAERKLFAQWLALPREQREPSTQTEFAEKHGVSTGSLSRWKGLDEVQEMVEEFREAPDPVELPEEMSDWEKQFHRARHKLFQVAMGEEDGDVQALKRWLDDFGTPFIEAERAALSGEFTDMDLEELFKEVLELVPADFLEDYVSSG